MTSRRDIFRQQEFMRKLAVLKDEIAEVDRLKKKRDILLKSCLHINADGTDALISGYFDPYCGICGMGQNHREQGGT